MTNKELKKEVENSFKSFTKLLCKIEYVNVVKIPALKEKYKKKYNNLLLSFFNIKNNPDFFIKSSLNQTFTIYKKSKDKNEFILELNFIDDIKTKKFIDFIIKTEGKIGKSKDQLKILTFLGKVSKILETKKSFFIEKCFNCLLDYRKAVFKIIEPSRISMKEEKSRDATAALLRKKYILNNLYNNKGFYLDYIHKDLNEFFDWKPGIKYLPDNVDIPNVDNFKFVKNEDKTTTVFIKSENNTKSSNLIIEDIKLDTFIGEISKQLEGILGLEDCHSYYKNKYLTYCKNLSD